MAQEVLIKNVDSVESIIYYQIDCIQKHPEIPILPIRVAVLNHQVCLENDVSNKIRLRDYLESHTLSRNDWIGLLYSIGRMLQKGMDYFLDPACFEISLSTMFYPSGQETFQPGNIQYRYIPVIRDSPSDPLRSFYEEISSFELTPSLFSTESERDGSACEFLQGIFTQKEQECIAGWSLASLKEGLANIQGMMGYQDKTDQFRKKRPVKIHPSLKILSPFHICSSIRKIKPSIFPSIRFWGRTRSDFKDLDRNASLSPRDSSPGTSGYLFIFIILGIEMVLIFLAFQILHHQAGFNNRFTPVLLVSGILLCFGWLDLFLLFSKKSPLHLARNKDSSILSQGENDMDSIFRLKEEKTVLLEHSEEPRRIAMICSGIPGTPEESTGLKAYILVDEFIIGRDSAKVDFKINSLSIGRVHARITRKENSFFIEDLESKNGTYLDQKKLKKNEEVLLPGNCKIRFAEREFYFVVN